MWEGDSHMTSFECMFPTQQKPQICETDELLNQTLLVAVAASRILLYLTTCSVRSARRLYLFQTFQSVWDSSPTNNSLFSHFLDPIARPRQRDCHGWLHVTSQAVHLKLTSAIWWVHQAGRWETRTVFLTLPNCWCFMANLFQIPCHLKQGIMLSWEYFHLEETGSSSKPYG